LPPPLQPSAASARRADDGGWLIGADAQLATDSGACAKITDELLAAAAAAAGGKRVHGSRINEIVSLFCAPSHHSPLDAGCSLETAL